MHWIEQEAYPMVCTVRILPPVANDFLEKGHHFILGVNINIVHVSRLWVEFHILCNFRIQVVECPPDITHDRAVRVTQSDNVRAYGSHDLHVQRPSLVMRLGILYKLLEFRG